MTDEKTRNERRVMIDARYIQQSSSGIGRYTEHLVRELLELDATLRLRLVTHPSRPRPVDSDRVECVTYDASPNSLRTRFAMAKALDFSGVDLFHSPFNILPGNLPVPSVFTLHDIMWLIDPGYCTDSRWRRAVTGTFYRTLIPRSVIQASEIMTVSHHSRKEIERYFPEMRDHVHVTYNGVDPFFHVREPEECWDLVDRYIPRTAPFVLVVGQGSPYKNHAGALAGFIEAFRDDPEVHFVLVRRFSRGPAHRLHQLMRDPAVRDRIVHLEHVSGEELRALYNLAKVFLFPSFYEGFGLPALEAMACGTPVVASDRGAPAEVCGGAAVEVDPDDDASIGHGLRRLFDDPALWEKKRELGLEQAARFTWRRCAQQALDVYRRIV